MTKPLSEKLRSIPRIELGFFPTPLYKLDKLSEELGVHLYIKRDDLTGKNNFGGNKTRKLEYLLGAAKEDKCAYVLTYGATQSNHAMQTVWTAVSNGFKPVLYLVAVVKPDEERKANLLLDAIYDAEVHLVDIREGESYADAAERSRLLAKERMNQIMLAGASCYDIPAGGANAVGTLGYISCMNEIYSQTTHSGITFDYLYHATGSGGTMAGLVAGQKVLGLKTIIKSVATLETAADYEERMAQLAVDSLALLGLDELVQKSDFHVEKNFYAPGYEKPSPAATKAIKRLAKTEGILLDPVYTGKAFSALLHDIQQGLIEPGCDVLFLHTGGVSTLFAEKEIIGDITEPLS